ncbi:hypothetical protein ENBRE01_1091 [Enteropsectra breve]|nr:hypothetical protein ENBRE01_1091 [Enteropsectra breve]
MPIRGLDIYVQKFESIKKPLDILKETRIAIDGFWFLRKYTLRTVSAPQTIEEMKTKIFEALEPLIQLGKTTDIIWIWDGLTNKRAISTTQPKTERQLEKIISSTNYMALSMELYVKLVTEHLRKHKITVIRAPYSAVAQCIYFEKEHCVKYIFSKNDALIYPDCQRVITDFSFENKELTLLERPAILSSLGISLATFQHFSILLGCEICPTVTAYAQSNKFSFDSILALAKEKNYESTIRSYEESENGSYLDAVKESYISVIFHPVMTIDGTVDCLNSNDIPSDLESIFGEKFPGFLYNLLFNCQITPKMFDFINCFLEPKIVESKIAPLLKGFMNQLESMLNLVLESKDSEIFEMGTDREAHLVSSFISKILLSNGDLEEKIDKGVFILAKFLAENQANEVYLSDLLGAELMQKNEEQSFGHFGIEKFISRLEIGDCLLALRDVAQIVCAFKKLKHEVKDIVKGESDSKWTDKWSDSYTVLENDISTRVDFVSLFAERDSSSLVNLNGSISEICKKATHRL